MKNNINNLLEKICKNDKISYQELEKQNLSEEMLNEIIKYSLDNNIEIQYDLPLNESGTDDTKSLDSISMYFNEIKKIPLLTPEQEKKLAFLSRNGHEEAKQKLVEHNLRLVVSIANRYRNLGLPLSDLIQEGNIGLLKAVEKFDVTKGYKFSTYATWWIKQTITRTITEKRGLIRIPTYTSEKIKKIKYFISQFEINNGRKPTIKEITQSLNITEETVKLIIQNNNVLEFEKPVNNETDTTFIEFIKDENQTSIENTIIDKMLIEQIKELLENDKLINERDKNIIYQRYGIIDGREKTLEEIASLYDLSRQRVCAIEKTVLKKLKNRLEDNENKTNKKRIKK